MLWYCNVVSFINLRICATFNWYCNIECAAHSLLRRKKKNLMLPNFGFTSISFFGPKNEMLVKPTRRSLKSAAPENDFLKGVAANKPERSSSYPLNSRLFHQTYWITMIWVILYSALKLPQIIEFWKETLKRYNIVVNKDVLRCGYAPSCVPKLGELCALREFPWVALMDDSACWIICCMFYIIYMWKPVGISKIDIGP